MGNKKIVVVYGEYEPWAESIMLRDMLELAHFYGKDRVMIMEVHEEQKPETVEKP